MPAPPRGALLRAAPLIVAAVLAGSGSPPGAGPEPGAAGFESPSGLAIVRAVVPDGRGLRLLLDTGDPGGLTLLAAAARSLGVVPGPARPDGARGVIGRATVSRSPARMPSITIGGTTFRDLEIDVVPDPAGPREGDGHDVDGYLGSALLADFRLTLDYPRRTLALCPSPDPGDRPVSATGSGGAGLVGSPLRLVEGRLLTTVLVGGERRTALIDTGAAVTLVDRSLAESGSPAIERAVRLVDAAGAVETLTTRPLAGLEAGGAGPETIEAIPVDLARRLDGFLPPGSPRIDLVLGADLLARHRVTLDPRAGLFILEGPRP